jgi:hypothetical protein
VTVATKAKMRDVLISDRLSLDDGVSLMPTSTGCA